MKLIVAGATGLLGSEIIKQSLRIPEITTVIALARRPIKFVGKEPAVDSSKLKEVLVKDYGEYPDDVKVEFAGADACIWTVAVTPFRMNQFGFAEVKRVCQTCTISGFEAMYEAGPSRPFRFIYLSAEGTPLDLSKKPRVMGDYQIMRGETEHMVQALSKLHKDVEVCIPHPGVITNSTTWWRAALATMFKITNAITFNAGFPNIDRSQLAAAILEQAVRGFEKQMLSNGDLVRLGTAAASK